MDNTFPTSPEPTTDHIIQLGKLLAIPTMEQRTPEWFEMRNNMITASAAAAALGEGHFGNKKDLILKKCGKGKIFTGNKYTEWGVKHEAVATRLYELRSSTKIHEFGVLQHPKYSFLGASPDGINEKGIMLEIKCPYSRKITGIVPHHYWIQIQLQLEVCNLDLCDFLECKIVEYKNLKEYLEDSDDVEAKILYDGCDIPMIRTKDKKEKGVIITYVTPDGDNKYYHSELGITEDNIPKWEEKIAQEIPSCWGKRSVSYWKFDFISCVRVPRDKKWFDEKLQKFEETWKEILHYRKVGCEDLFPKKKKLCKDLQNEWARIQDKEKRNENIDEKGIGGRISPTKISIPVSKPVYIPQQTMGNIQNFQNVQTDKKIRSTNNVSEYEALFEIELASWILPKYIPIYPLVLDKQSLCEVVLRIVGINKLVSRCKTALVRLLKVENNVIENFHINIRNILHQLHNWVSGLTSFCKDLKEVLQEEIKEEVKECISNIIVITEKWNTKLYPKWEAKFV